jgi:ferredoxin-nitrate reductase
MSSAVAAYKIALGEDSVPVCYDDIELADCFYVTGANPAWCHPILWRRVEAHKAANPDVKIIVVDPRATDTCGIADLHLQINPGTDITLNHAIGRVLIENGDIDLDFITNHADGFEQYSRLVFERSVAEAAQICGVAESDIRLAAKYIGEAKGFISMWTMGLNQSAIGVNKNLSLINLNLITGHIGKPGSGPAIINRAAKCHGRARSWRFSQFTARSSQPGQPIAPGRSAKVLGRNRNCRQAGPSPLPKCLRH